MKITGLLLALILALPAAPMRAAHTAAAAPAGPSFLLSGVNFDSAMVFNMYNTVLQSNSTVNSFSFGSNAGVLAVTIKNTGSASGYCYFVAKAFQNGNGSFGCGSQPLVISPVLQTLVPVPAGATIHANASSFGVVPGLPYQFPGTGASNCLKNYINQFTNGSSSGPSSIPVQQIVQTFETAQLQICLYPTDASGNPLGGQACTSMSVFTQPPANISTCAMLIYPHNNGISTFLPAFMWTPAYYNGSSNNIQYTMVLSKSLGGVPWYSVVVPPNQTFYQYQATDRALEAGVKYYYYVLSTVANGSNKPVGGMNGQGWNTQKWFIINSGVGPLASLVTLPDLSALVRQNASAAVNAALQGMALQSVGTAGAQSDPSVAAVLANPSRIKSISIVKKAQ